MFFLYVYVCIYIYSKYTSVAFVYVCVCVCVCILIVYQRSNAVQPFPGWLVKSELVLLEHSTGA